MTNFVRSVQARIKRQAHGRKLSRSLERSSRLRRRQSSSGSSEDSYGRTRKRKASSSARRPASSDAESPKEAPETSETMQALQAAVQSAQDRAKRIEILWNRLKFMAFGRLRVHTISQERLAKVESEARDEERLKLSKAEDEPWYGDLSREEKDVRSTKLSQNISKSHPCPNLTQPQNPKAKPWFEAETPMSPT